MNIFFELSFLWAWTPYQESIFYIGGGKDDWAKDIVSASCFDPDIVLCQPGGVSNIQPAPHLSGFSEPQDLTSKIIL